MRFDPRPFAAAFGVWLVLAGALPALAGPLPAEPLFTRLEAQGASTAWYGAENQTAPRLQVQTDPGSRTVTLSQPGSPGSEPSVARFDPQGRLGSFEAPGRTLRYRFVGTRVQTSLGTAETVSRVSDEPVPVLDAAFVLMFAGTLPLGKLGDEVRLRTTPPQEPDADLETSDFESYLRVVGRSSQTTPAGTFPCLELEFGFSGFVGLWTPKFRLWVDEVSRRTIAYRLERDDPQIQRIELKLLGS